MVSSVAALAVILSARTFVQADLHHVFVPSFTSPHLYSLEFDDANNTIAQAGHIVGNDGHPWISFSYDKASLYAGETNGFASYTVDNSTSLSYKKSVPLPGSCNQKLAGFGATYVLPLQKAPFTVYGAPFGSCLSAMSVEPDGTLMAVVQNVTLDSGSGIHGLAMGPDAEFLYSADDSANGIWVHKINQETGAVTKVSFTLAPSVNAGPRHLIVHPTGRFLYVVMESRNEVRVYAVNFGQRSGQEKITDTGLSYSLVPQGANPADYMATEVILSADSNILFASTRYRALRAQSQGNSPSVRGPLSKEDVYHHKSRRSPVLQRRAPQSGYVTAILLVPQSEQSNPEFPQGAGFPLRQLFQTKTTTSGGMSNAVSPAPWDRNYFTISDTEIGQVEVWKIEGTKEDRTFYTGPVGQNAATHEKGGWENGMWVENPTIIAPPAPAAPYTSIPKPVTPKPPTQPSNPWGPKSGGGSPWQNAGGNGNPWGANSPSWTTPQTGQSGRPGWGGWNGYRPSSGSGSRGGGDDDDEDERKKNRPVESSNPPAEESAADEEEEDEKRRKGKARVVGPVRRQAPVAPPAVPVPVAVPVTARVVATWKAPKGNLPRVRRTLRDGGLLGRRQSNDSVPATGGCCGNALWWD